MERKLECVNCMKTLTDHKVPPQYCSKISLTSSLHSMSRVLRSCEGHIKPNWNREACGTSHQVYSNIILQGLCKDDRPSEGDSWGNTVLTGTHDKRNEAGNHRSRNWKWSNILRRRKIIKLYVFLGLFQE